MSLYIMLVGKICGDDFAWIIPPPPAVDEIDAPATCSYFAHPFPPVDSLTQEAIDAAHAEVLAEEWQDYFLDEEFNRGGY